MSAYDSYYQTEHLFGMPYPELIAFFSEHPTRGRLLDLGCGQGRDALALARLGYEVTGLDLSVVGIRQMVQQANAEKLKITGIVKDIYEFEDYGGFDFILLDSMFHFRKQELKQETALVRKVIEHSGKGTLIIFCIQDTGNKIRTFENITKNLTYSEMATVAAFKYRFEDKEANHRSETNYKMMVIRK